jgi:hypothetical protein
MRASVCGDPATHFMALGEQAVIPAFAKKECL